jgi:hypothetical protein
MGTYLTDRRKKINRSARNIKAIAKRNTHASRNNACKRKRDPAIGGSDVAHADDRDGKLPRDGKRARVTRLKRARTGNSIEGYRPLGRTGRGTEANDQEPFSGDGPAICRG